MTGTLRLELLSSSPQKEPCSYEERPWGLSIYDSFSGLITQSASDFLRSKDNTVLSQSCGHTGG